ncbi:heavy metal-binding domain-containing protein [Sulfurimonas crateris]|uniref:Heavy metal-binding domain-containing protein n=1 Tax=Sulfurimonas crateris TaxID=2574727 RepID=A0A4U2Z633_9BACT|nr:heavy metal-binding domain-containing protein [Sulfurimonas crateris]TKI69658.1 heavy metal-binding domain-containing protein [Sulfurimonas crateris]
MEFASLLIFSFFVLIVWSQISSKKKAKERSTNMDEMLNQLRNEVLSISGSSIPGKEVKKIIGMVRGVSDTQASRKEEFELAEKEALYKMLMEAKSLGANAVIDIKLNTGTYERQGSKWQVSQAVYNGTAVEV